MDKRKKKGGSREVLEAGRRGNAFMREIKRCPMVPGQNASTAGLLNPLLNWSRFVA